MEKHRTNSATASPALLDETWFDPIETAIRSQIRGFIEALVDEELDQALGRPRYQRPKRAERTEPTARVGYRHGRRQRQLLGSFGPVIISVPRARLNNGDGTNREWRSEVLPRYARRTKQAEALIAGAYLSGTNTRRVRRALGSAGGGVERYREPGLAEAAGGVGNVVPPFARRGARRAAHS
jgi:putative transposase